MLTQRGLPAPQASALAGLACGTHLFSAEERLVAAAAACLAALCWAGAEGRSLRAEDEAPLLGLATAVFRASGQVRLNAFGLHPPWNSGRDTAYAQAVYPTASLANHACRPSISVYFDVRPVVGEDGCVTQEDQGWVAKILGARLYCAMFQKPR